MRKERKGLIELIFIVSLVLIFLVFAISEIKTNNYNNETHKAAFSGSALFSNEENENEGVTVKAIPRSSTWGKIFDLYDEGLTENNYQAYTYDFTVSNNTKDELDDFTFKLTFSKDVFLASAWNGALEVHQTVNGQEVVSTVPDLREFKPSDHPLETVTFDGENFIYMKAGDYFIYIPSSTMNAMEIPIEPYEGTTPGFIMYILIGESIEDSVLDLDYSFNRAITSEPLFWVSVIGLAIWLIALIVYSITSA